MDSDRGRNSGEQRAGLGSQLDFDGVNSIFTFDDSRDDFDSPGVCIRWKGQDHSVVAGLDLLASWHVRRVFLVLVSHKEN